MAINENTEYIIDSGTLNIAIGNATCIVLASDSRRTLKSSSGRVSYSDDCKKLFLIGTQRGLLISGFAGLSHPDLADNFIIQLPTTIEDTINRCKEGIDFYDHKGWQDVEPPADYPEEFKKHWYSTSPYTWWSYISGSLCLLGDIFASFGQDVANNFMIVGLHAGYKENGDIKIERLMQIPIQELSNFGRISYAAGQTLQYRVAKDFLWDTAGQTEFSSLILQGKTNDLIEENMDLFPSFQIYFTHLKERTIHKNDRKKKW